MIRPRLSVLLLALPLAACGRPDTTISAEPAPLVAEAPRPGGPADGLPPAQNGILAPGAADKILPAGGKPVVKVLELGAEPRADLGYAFTKGAAQKLAMAMDTTMAIRAQGQSPPATTIPRMTMAMDTTVTDKNAGGEAKIESLLTGVGVEPSGAQQEQMARALKAPLDAMKGLSMGYWVNPKGNVRDVKIAIPPGMPPQAQQLLSGLSQSFESMVTPLPTEAVGVGARWQVITRTVTGGADILQSAVYTLKSKNGQRAALDVKVVQLAASDTIQAPNMPAGMSAKVKAFSSGGSGTTNLDLKSVVPENGSMTLKVAMTLQVQGAGPGAGDETAIETTTAVHIARP